MGKLESFLNKYTLALLLVLVLPAVVALLVPGFYGASDEVHIGWLKEMDRVVQSLKFPPRFVPDLSYGFGYPLFNFVFPLPFYIAEIFHIAGFNLVDSIKLLFLISIPISALAMYFLLREYSTKSLSLMGAILYAYGPYRAVDIYIRGAIGEIVAFVFLPLIILSLKKVIELEEFKKSVNWIGLGGISLGLLVLSHNIATYMFVPFAVLFALINVFFKKGKGLIPAVSIFVSGMLVSIYFWVPAVLDSNFMKYDTVFNFIDHFPTLKQLVTPYWGYGASVPGPYDGMSFFLGFTQIFVLIGGTIGVLVFWKKLNLEEKGILVWVVISLLITFFMMNFRSTFVWRNTPFLPYFQFPWRFLMMTTFLIPLFVILGGKLKNSTLIALVIIIITILLNQNYFRPQDFLGRTDGYFLNKYVPYPEVGSQYLQNQEEYLRLPKYTERRPDKIYPLVYDEHGEEIREVILKNSLDVSFKSNFGESEKINYSKYYFPGWEAKIDGKSVEIITGKPFGQISILVPSGNHQVSIEFNETFQKKLLDILSVIVLIILLVFIVKPKFLKIK